MEDAMLIFAFVAALLTYFAAKQGLTFMGMGHPVAALAVAALTFMALYDNEIGVPIMASYGAFGVALVLILLLMFLRSVFVHIRGVRIEKDVFDKSNLTDVDYQKKGDDESDV